MHTRPLAFLLLASSAGVALAQNLPPSSRTVYKCDAGGKFVYSDSPCLGAQRVDVQPTRGVDRSTGVKQTGADVRNERLNESIAHAVGPVLGETPEQRATRHRRAKMTSAEKGQCARLDRTIAEAETREKTASRTELGAAQQHLYELRQQNQNLRC